MNIGISLAALASLTVAVTASTVAAPAVSTFRTVYFPDGRAFCEGQGKVDLDLETEAGEVDEAMRRFFDICEELFKDGSGRVTASDRTKGCTFARIAAADAALEEAVSAAKAGSSEALRVKLVRKVWSALRLALDAAACRQALATAGSPEEAVRFVRQAFGDVEAFRKTALTQAEEKEAFRDARKCGFVRWKEQAEKSFASQVLLENAADASFERLAKKLGKEKAKAFLAPLAKDPVLGPLAEARLYLLDNTPRDFVVNGSFEDPCDPVRLPGDEADWDPLGAKGGWVWWKFPNTQARASVDGTTARSGKRSAVIEKSTSGCSLINRWKVAPRTLYRLSCWVKEECPGGRAAGTVSVRLRNGRGQWIDCGKPIVRQIPDAAVGSWVEMRLLFTTPDREDWVGLVSLFSPDDSSPDGCLLTADRLWIDDVRLEKLSNAAFAGRPQTTYRLAWQDDFGGTSLDTNLWRRLGKGGSDWNRHMSEREDLVELRDGALVLWGKANADTNADPRPFLTGGVITRGDKGTIRHGRIEIRAKFEDQKGAWPAFWMLPQKPDPKGRGWPWYGEIDIVERLNSNDFVHQTVHSGWTVEKKMGWMPVQGGKGPIRQDDWNVYGLEITRDELIWSVNGKETFSYPKVECGDPDQWPFGTPFGVLLDMQLGGEWVGKVDVSTLPVRTYVDWIRAYDAEP